MATRILPSLRRPAPAHVLVGSRPPLPFLPLLAMGCFVLLVVRWWGSRSGLAADVKDALDDRDHRPDEDDAKGEFERRDADARPRDDDAERDDHEADFAGHDAHRSQAHAGGIAERVGLRPDV